MFEVGNKIKCNEVDDHGWDLKLVKGGTYTVDGYSDAGLMHLKEFKEKDPNGFRPSFRPSFRPDRFELIKEKKVQTKVKYIHIRLDETTSKGGGMTVCFALDGHDLVLGISYCNEKDTFNKKIGREKAQYAFNKNPIKLRYLTVGSILFGVSQKQFQEHGSPEKVIKGMFT